MRIANLRVVGLLAACLSLQAPAAAQPDKGPFRIQVGDLVFVFPGSIPAIGAWRSPPDSRFAYPSSMVDSTAKQVERFSISQRAAWPMSGTHAPGPKYEGSDIRISLFTIDDQARAQLCQSATRRNPGGLRMMNDGFYVLEENADTQNRRLLAPESQKLFGGSIVAYATPIKYGDVEKLRDGVAYNIQTPLSKHAGLQVYLSTPDILDVTIFRVLDTVERNLRSYIAQTPFSPVRLGLDAADICASGGRS